MIRPRRLDLTFAALLIPFDALALYAAGFSAYILRYSRFVTEIRPIIQDLPLTSYLSDVTTLIPFWLIVFALSGLYLITPRKAWNELGRVFVACGAGTLLTITLAFFQRELTTSRFIVLAVFGFSFLYVSLSRLVLRFIRHALLQYRIGHTNIVIIGSSPALQSLVDAYRHRPILGKTVTQVLPKWNAENRSKVEALIRSERADEILLADPDLPKEHALDIIAFAEEHHLGFSYLADMFAASFTNIHVGYETGVPIISVVRTRLDGWGRIVKRAFDIVISVILLLIMSPILLLSTLILALEDGFPILFKNERVGEHGRIFSTYKLRSMWRKFSIGSQFQRTAENLKLEAELIQKKSIKQGPVYKIAKDPRVTPFGKFIRRWSIDELPQFWNVLRGDMSLVGPRPHQTREVAAYQPHHRRVLAIRPGITGLAQISGRSDLTFEEEVRLDTWYIENWTPWLDLYILLKTPFAVLQQKGAY